MNTIKNAILRFMKGRYGVDILGKDLIIISLLLTFINFFIQSSFISITSLVLIMFAYLRMFSKKYSSRYNENRVYTNLRFSITRPMQSFWKKIVQFPKYKILKCPTCDQKLRVPRGKKNIVVTCTKCKTRFDAKS